MIKFTAVTEDGRELIGLGISEGNVQRLRAGDPIKVNLQEMGFTAPIDLLIFYGKDEQQLADMVRPGINEQTVVHEDPKLELQP